MSRIKTDTALEYKQNKKLRISGVFYCVNNNNMLCSALMKGEIL